jgi:LIM domain kinase 1
MFACILLASCKLNFVDHPLQICSEFIPSGNLRTFIARKNRPFPWRLRISFATDIARAVAYLHARKASPRQSVFASTLQVNVLMLYETVHPSRS